MERISQTMQTLDFDVELLTFFQRGKRPTEYKIATRHVLNFFAAVWTLKKSSTLYNLLMRIARNLREKVESHPCQPILGALFH